MTRFLKRWSGILLPSAIRTQLLPMRKSPCPESIARSADTSLARTAAVWFIGLSGLYVLYASWSYPSLAAHTSSVQAIIMLSGQTTVAMSLLLVPSVFAAALDKFHPLDGTGPRTRLRGWAQVALMGLLAYLLSRFGPNVFRAFMQLVRGEPSEATPTIAPQVIEAAQEVLPTAIGIFVVVAGVAGSLVGELAAGLNPTARRVLRWLGCLILMASFFFPLMATRPILRSGSVGLWILWSPLAFPVIVTGATGLWQWRRRAASLLPHPRRGESDITRESLDRIVSGVIAADVNKTSDLGAIARTKAESEVAHLAYGVRRALAPRSTVSEARVRKIVEVLSDPGRSEATGVTPSLDARWSPAGLADFCISWACLSVGLLIVGAFGGVPPSVALAAAAGLVGALAIIPLAHRIGARTGMASV